MGMVIPPIFLGGNTTLKNPENPEGCHWFLTQMAPFFGQLMTPKLWTRLKEHPNQVIFSPWIWGWDGSAIEDYAKKLEDYAKAGDWSLFSLIIASLFYVCNYSQYCHDYSYYCLFVLLL